MTATLTHQTPFSAAAIELAKLRRTRIITIATLISGGIVLFTSMNLFASGQIDAFREDPHTNWAGYLIGYYMALALLSPLQMALMASWSADTEHSGSGWRLNAVAGIRPGNLIRRKFFVLAAVVAGLKLCEFLTVLTLPVLLGAPFPDEVLLTTWGVSSLGAAGTSLAVLAILLWLAARVESQLVVIGIGVIGGFLGIAALLSPPWLAAINPFGYYAVVTPYSFSEAGVISTAPNWLLWAIYLASAACSFFLLTCSLNNKEL